MVIRNAPKEPKTELDFSGVPEDVLAAVGVEAICYWLRWTPQAGLRLCPCCGCLGTKHHATCVMPSALQLIEGLQ